MLNIKISFLSLLVDLTNQENILLEIKENSTIKDILKVLVSKFGKNFEQTIFNSPNNVNKYLLLSLNGEDIRSFDNLDTILHDGDEIILLPAIAGG